MSEQKKSRKSDRFLILAIMAVIVFASLQVTGSALADSGHLEGCGAPAIFKSGGLGLSVAALWWLGEQVVSVPSML